MFMRRPKSYGKHEDIVLRAHIELSRAFLKIRAKEIAWLAQQGLTLTQFAILEALYHLGELSVGEITKVILSTPGNMTVVIKNLHTKGLIEVFPSPKDKRIKILRITSEGRAIIETIFPGHVEHLVSLYDQGLSESER